VNADGSGLAWLGPYTLSRFSVSLAWLPWPITRAAQSRKEIWHQQHVKPVLVIKHFTTPDNRTSGDLPTTYGPVDTLTCQRLNQASSVSYQQRAPLLHRCPRPPTRQQVTVTPGDAFDSWYTSGGVLGVITLPEKSYLWPLSTVPFTAMCGYAPYRFLLIVLIIDK
jgi:hypothetical protein